MITLSKNFNLLENNTFRISSYVRYFCKCYTTKELIEYIKYAINLELNYCILGEGSNVLFVSHFLNSLIIHPKLMGINILNKKKDICYVEAYCGEKWSKFVDWAVYNKLSGVENLALIPGTVGAAPIQNIGAYGVEIKDVIYGINVLNTNTMKLVFLNLKECNFKYRSSIFKGNLFNPKYIIISVIFKLKIYNHILHLNYPDLKKIIWKFNIPNERLNIEHVSNIVKYIRISKLPNFNLLHNAGSFFKNPIVNKDTLDEILSINSNIKFFLIKENMYKISAASLIDSIGWRGIRLGDAGVYEKQCLVLINYGKAEGKDILTLANLIINDVYNTYKVYLDIEVNIF